MTSLQRQAVLVCVVCALAALLTVGITLTLLKRGKPETPGTPADSVPTDTTGDGESTDLANHYQIDNTSSALLKQRMRARNIWTAPCFWEIPTPCVCITTV